MKRALALAALLLAGCSKDDGRIPIVVYSPHGEDILRDFERSFEQAHPEADVRPFNYSSVACLDKLRAEAANPSCDLLWGTTWATHAQLAAEGLLEPYRPSFRVALAADRADREDRFTAQFVMPQVIIYNRDALQPAEAPQSWDELTDPKWRDRIILRFPMPASGMRGAFSWLVAWKGGPAADPAPGFAFLRGLARNTKRYAADPTELFEAVKKDQNAVASIWNLTDALFQRDRYRYPLGTILPVEGVPVLLDCIALTANPARDARRAELARAFYEFVSTHDALERLMVDHWRIPARGDVPRERMPAWLKDLAFTPLPVDPAIPLAHEAEWMRRWDEEVKGTTGEDG